MKLFIDTGNIKEIEPLAALGILDGVTTNPSLVAKTGRNRLLSRQTNEGLSLHDAGDLFRHLRFLDEQRGRRSSGDALL